MKLSLVKVLLITIFILSISCSVAFGQVYNVGYRVYDFPDEQGRVLTVAVWYPTNAYPKPYSYQSAVKKIGTKIAVNAPVLKTSTLYPLIIFSHGAGGSGLQSPFLTEKLASAGYVVVAIDHEDKVVVNRIKQKETVTPEKFKAFLQWIPELRAKFQGGPSVQEEYAYRFKDVKLAIDQMLALNNNPHSPFYRTIDANKIGMCGHSFGGFTTMVVSGAIPSYKDSRIKAAICYSGPVGQVFSPKQLKHIQIPVMIMFGEQEKGKQEGTKWQYSFLKKPRFLLEIKQAGHNSFAIHPYLSSFTTVQQCQQDPRVKVIVNYSTAFFDLYLKKDKQKRFLLESTDSSLVLYKKEI